MPPEKIATPPPAAPPANDDRIKRAEAEGASRALESENQRLQQIIAAQNRGTIAPPPPPAQPPQPDPLDALVEGDQNLTLPPEKRRQLLSDAINRRADVRASATEKKLREESAWMIQQAKNEMALTGLWQANPEIAKDEEGLGAAMAKAKIRAARQGVDLNGPELVRYAVEIYKEGAPAVPGVEGASRPDSQAPPGTQPPAGPRKPTWFEKTYGASKRDELIEDDPDFSKMTDDYTYRKNKALAAMDIRSGMREVLSQYEERRSEEDPSLLRQEI